MAIGEVKWHLKISLYIPISPTLLGRRAPSKSEIPGCLFTNTTRRFGYKRSRGTPPQRDPTYTPSLRVLPRVLFPPLGKEIQV